MVYRYYWIIAFVTTCRFLDNVSPPVHALRGVHCPTVSGHFSQEGELVLLRCLHVHRNLTNYNSSECPQLVGIRCCKSPTYSTG